MPVDLGPLKGMLPAEIIDSMESNNENADAGVKISSVDTTEGFASTKIVAGDGIQTNILNPGANEVLEIVRVPRTVPYQLNSSGSVVSNTPTGVVAIPSGQTQITVTCSVCTANSTVLLAQRAGTPPIDATAVNFAVTPSAGSFTIVANAAATLQVTFNYAVIGTGAID